jgi:hypothetical protein
MRLAFRQVVRAQGEQDGFAVGRYVQIFYSANAVKVLDGEGAFGGTAGDGQQQKADYDREKSLVHEAPRLEAWKVGQAIDAVTGTRLWAVFAS